MRKHTIHYGPPQERRTRGLRWGAVRGHAPSSRNDHIHLFSTGFLRLVSVTVRDPFHGPGMPEPLKAMNGCWSRRLTHEHRFVYRVTATTFECVQARFQYRGGL